MPIMVQLIALVVVITVVILVLLTRFLEAEGAAIHRLSPPRGFMSAPWRGDFPPGKGFIGRGHFPLPMHRIRRLASSIIWRLSSTSPAAHPYASDKHTRSPTAAPGPPRRC